MRGGYDYADHLQLLDVAIAECIDTEDGRLGIELPPRHGKSKLAAISATSWALGRNPYLRIAIACGALSLAGKHSRAARQEFAMHAPAVWGLDINPENNALVDWGVRDARTKEVLPGGFRAYGVGSLFTGEGADVLVLDDLIPDAEAANSEVQRENVWDWIETVAWTRLEPGASVIAIMTRWHEDDPHGRMRERMTEEGFRWIRLPAICDEPDDPLGREIGEPLWPKRWTLERLEKKQASSSTRTWNSLFQQRPTALEGGVWKRAWWRNPDRTYRIREERGMPLVLAWDGARLPLEHLLKFVVVDIATTEKKLADYTVIGCFGLTREPFSRLVLLDFDRAQMEGPEINPRVKRMLARWDAAHAYYEVAGQQATVVQYAKLEGIPARTIARTESADVRISGDKINVAYEATPWAGQGRILLPVSATWLADWEHEMLTFPNAAHDDMEDVTAWAFHVANYLDRSGLLSAQVRGEVETRDHDRVMAPKRRDPLDAWGPSKPEGW